MSKVFNVTGNCDPNQHYMVDLTSRLDAIKKMVDKGQYITINRGRQYGKTTTLIALEQYISDEYYVLNMDFQNEMSSAGFKDEYTFSSAFADAFIFLFEYVQTNGEIDNALSDLKKASSENINLVSLFRHLSKICKAAQKPVVLIIDEVDIASNNQVFLDFLAQLRVSYLRRNKFPTFQSVILAGVHDIRNLQLKIRPDSEHKHNGPWNIANALEVDMSFSPSDIEGMLSEYESDHHTGMNIGMIYDYTSGYPVLVSMFCLNMEKILERFTVVYAELYGGHSDEFLEDAGRRLFLLFIRPIINGSANYYIEAQTRNQRRTDLIIDYKGKQYIIEMKIWHGKEYNERGERQLAEYLEYYHIDKGYMLSFNFNKNKQSGTHTIRLGEKTIFEAIV